MIIRKTRFNRRIPSRLLLGLLASIFLLGTVDAGEKTERFWRDLERKYEGENLVCLQDDVVLDVEFTGETQRRDVDATSMSAAEELSAAMGTQIQTAARYTTIRRHTKKYAVLDAVGAARMREVVVPYGAGQTLTRHSVEIVDRTGNRLETPDTVIQVRSAYPDEAELYQRVKELVFRLEDLPVPCVVNLYYTVEGEEANGFLDRTFAAPLATYRYELTYNFPISYASNPWWQNTLKSLRITEPEEKSIASARGEIFQWTWEYKNLKPVPPEPYSPTQADLAPRVMFSPAFQSSWANLLTWYATAVEQSLERGGSDRVLRDPVVAAIQNGQELKRQKLEAQREAERAALLAFEGGAEEGEAEVESTAAGPEAAVPPISDEELILTEREKAEAIYHYLQEHYEVLPMELGREGYIPNRPVDVFELERVAPKDLAILLLGMLRLADLEADYALVSTRSHGGIREEFPALFQFNLPIVVFRVDGTPYFLDPTAKAVGIEDPPAEIENQLVLVVRAGEPEWLAVPMSSYSRNSLTVDGTVTWDKAGEAHKKFTASCRGEMNRVFRREFYVQGWDAGEEARGRWLARNAPEGAKVAEWSDNKGFSMDDPYEFTFDLVLPPALARVQGDSIVVSAAALGGLMPVQEFDVDPNRVNPIRFHFEEWGRDLTSLPIPEGYRLLSLPDDADYSEPFGRYLVSFTRFDDRIECEAEYRIEMTDVAAEMAPRLKEFFERIEQGAVGEILFVKVAEEEEGA